MDPRSGDRPSPAPIQAHRRGHLNAVTIATTRPSFRVLRRRPDRHAAARETGRGPDRRPPGSGAGSPRGLVALQRVERSDSLPGSPDVRCLRPRGVWRRQEVLGTWRREAGYASGLSGKGGKGETAMGRGERGPGRASVNRDPARMPLEVQDALTTTTEPVQVESLTTAPSWPGAGAGRDDPGTASRRRSSWVPGRESASPGRDRRAGAPRRQREGSGGRSHRLRSATRLARRGDGRGRASTSRSDCAAHPSSREH